MKEIIFDVPLDSLALPVKGGVAAFDPVTLHIAGGEYAERIRGEFHLPPTLRGALPMALQQLAEVEVVHGGVKATINTGLLQWDLEEDRRPVASDFKCYSGLGIQSVSFPGAQVIEMDGVYATSVPMKFPDGVRINAWFAELPSPVQDVDGLALLRRAQHWMARWYGPDTEKIQTYAVDVPVLDITYESDISAVAADPLTLVEQRFKARVDEQGVEVIAETEVQYTSLPPKLDSPSFYFGKRGAVLFWLSEQPDQLPFAIIQTNADAWLEAEDFWDWDEYEEDYEED